MKKLYIFAISLISISSFAQETISFEASEGFTTGNINGQKTWISTPTNSTPANVQNQVISAEAASSGSNSLKITKETAFGGQQSPIIGAFNNLAAPLTYTNFTLSFDMRITEKSASSSDFVFQLVNNTAQLYVTQIRCRYDGKVMVPTTVWNDTGSTWNINTWYRFKVEGTSANMKYYLNDVLIYTGAPMSTNNIDQIRFVHDNWSGTAYIDNIKINNESSLSTKDIAKNSETLSIYPNPATDIIKINTSNKIKHVEVYDLTGKRMNVTLDRDKVDVRNLSAGVYLLNVETEGRNFTEKFIKK
ncbi:T9SS C-terminal target domain-containing protein [Chryseobacterium sp. G0240]|uniref:T9SS type A sorting domain-containing protein n=1 Tax=Chryseobacterium sp. G0240 TaxID=2487066 RepID=UPI000F45AF99|nr:T9SS type A sorting domain-containing protein [Chryseobacterium sp. G0240]ROI05610.1 T9SS C-terminal target domain-containing protein [Chryseobacterium sp. G0240]